MQQNVPQPYAEIPAGSPAIGIVIPTYNRAADLLTCLRHLEAQTFKNFEVIVVDDGSTDNTRQQIEHYQPTSPFPVTYFQQPNSGPAKARNLAIAHTEAPLCILIGDDIFARRDFIQTHLDHHLAHPDLQSVGLGLTIWAEQGQTVTPFMRWLERDGMQFDYGALLAGKPPTWHHFYTSNLSFKTAYFQANPFHEGFPGAAMEDAELGYRLTRNQGLSLTFLPNAVAEHLHPMTFTRACRRMVGVGAATWFFVQLWPEQRPPKPSLFKRLLFPALGEPHVMLPALRAIANQITKFWCPNPLMRLVLNLHTRLGYQQAETRAAFG